jgi:hypothetical protein
MGGQIFYQDAAGDSAQKAFESARLVARSPYPKRKAKPKEIPDHAHPIVQFIFKKMNKKRWDMVTLGDKSCVSNGTIGTWALPGKIKSPGLDTVEKVLNALGYRLSIKLLENKPSEKIRHTKRIS